MNYEDTITFLYSQLPVYQRTGKAAYKANLDNTNFLDVFLDSPHRNYKSIHIAGTNGKGSVAHMIASVLQSSGLKVGLYTSPHLKSFRERIKVNGEMISKEYVIDFVQNSKDIISEISPSFFEMTVAMAFKYFADSNVDVAVIEVGLGGRLDSTNIISPILSVITNIGLDHTEFLGDSLRKIAIEKAGIIKPNVPIVIGQSHPGTKNVFIKKAKQSDSNIFFADMIYQVDYSLTTLDNKKSFNILKDKKQRYKDLKVDLLGNYQNYNLPTVLKSIDLLNEMGYNIHDDNVYKGLQNVVDNTGISGRWQVLGNNPLIIADTGHNIDGLKEVISQIYNTAYKNLHIVIGFVNDKNIDEILNLFPKNAKYYFTKAKIPRALDVKVLSAKASSIGLVGKVYEDVGSAIIAAKSNAEFNDLIFIGGSTFIVAEAI